MNERLAIVEIFDQLEVRELGDNVEHNVEREQLLPSRLPQLGDLLEARFDWAYWALEVAVSNWFKLEKSKSLSENIMRDCIVFAA